LSLLKSQLRAANAHLDACDSLASEIAKANDSTHALLSLKRELAEGKSSLAKINVRIVEADRRQRKSTEYSLDVHVKSARENFEATTIGVFAYLDNLHDDFSRKGNADAVETLEKIRRRARKAVRTLYFIVHPKLAFLLSGQCLLLIIVLGIIASCSLYVGHYATHPRSGLTPTQTVKESAASDAKKIHNAQASEGSFIDRSLKTTTTIIDLLPKVPKAILALTAAIAALQGLLAALTKPK
jgi:hypothetical protein